MGNIKIIVEKIKDINKNMIDNNIDTNINKSKNNYSIFLIKNKFIIIIFIVIILIIIKFLNIIKINSRFPINT